MYRLDKGKRMFIGQAASAGAIGAFGSLPTLSHANAGEKNQSAITYGDHLNIPTEEEPHDFCFMQWPTSKIVHPDPDFLGDLQDTIANIANAISQFEPVKIAAATQYHSSMRKKLSGNVEIWDIPTDDLWARDSGPIFAFDATGAPVVTGFNFNGWGNKQIHHHDGLVASRVAQFLDLPYRPAPLVGEAGGIEWNGQGILLAHESSWINSNRNKGSKEEITQSLLSFYGADRMIWAKGLKGEDITDYHIDSLARFVAPNEVVIQLPFDDGSWDIWVAAAEKTYEALHEAGMKIHHIDEPENPRVSSLDFVASYANYYVANGAVIGAEFGDQKTDEKAAATLKRLYPGREVVMLNVDAIGEVGGGIHCATQQCPKGFLS